MAQEGTEISAEDEVSEREIEVAMSQEIPDPREIETPPRSRYGRKRKPVVRYSP